MYGREESDQPGTGRSDDTVPSFYARPVRHTPAGGTWNAAYPSRFMMHVVETERIAGETKGAYIHDLTAITPASDCRITLR